VQAITVPRGHAVNCVARKTEALRTPVPLRSAHSQPPGGRGGFPACRRFSARSTCSV